MAEPNDVHNWVPIIGRQDGLEIDLNNCDGGSPCIHLVRYPDGRINITHGDLVAEAFRECGQPVPNHFEHY